MNLIHEHQIKPRWDEMPLPPGKFDSYTIQRDKACPFEITMHRLCKSDILLGLLLLVTYLKLYLFKM